MATQLKPTINPAPQAVGHFVCVKMPEAIVKLPSGLYIPEDTAEKQKHATMTAELVTVGADCKFLSREDIGSTVYFGRYAGVLVEDGEQKFRLIDEDEIRAIA